MFLSWAVVALSGSAQAALARSSETSTLQDEHDVRGNDDKPFKDLRGSLSDPGEVTEAMCLREPQKYPQECAAMSTKNCPAGLTALDIADRSGLDLTGKVALITGGRSGLGYRIAETLLHLGCTVIIASRDGLKNEAATKKLQEETGNTNISFMTFDLSSFDSVRSFAAKFLENYSRLDYYFGNAGQGPLPDVFRKDKPTTENGYERLFQVNYVSQILLVELLMDLLRSTQPSRIIFSSSVIHT